MIPLPLSSNHFLGRCFIQYYVLCVFPLHSLDMLTMLSCSLPVCIPVLPNRRQKDRPHVSTCLTTLSVDSNDTIDALDAKLLATLSRSCVCPNPTRLTDPLSELCPPSATLAPIPVFPAPSPTPARTSANSSISVANCSSVTAASPNRACSYRSRNSSAIVLFNTPRLRNHAT